MDFRSTLISLGRRAFESALNDPDSLAEIDIDRAWAKYEGYQYVAGKVYEEIKGDEMPEERPGPSAFIRKEPTGTEFQEWAMSTRYPRLVAKYGYKDSDWLSGKEQQEKAEQRQLSGERIANLMLDAGIIPSCGSIPPLRVVARVFQVGHSPEGAGQHFTWEAFKLDEGDYWAAIAELEKSTAEELRSRPEIRADKLKLDVQGPPGDDFGEWIESLRARSLM